MFTYLGPLYIGAGPNFDWPPKLTALMRMEEEFSPKGEMRTWI
jgi:hypothetical protein